VLLDQRVAYRPVHETGESPKSIVEDHFDEIVRLANLLTERGKLAAKEIAEFWNQRGQQ